LLRAFPRLIAVSDQIRQTLVDAGVHENRIHTILNGIDPHIFHRDRTRENAIRAAMKIDPRVKVIGAIGRLEPQKRFDILLQAFARLRSARPELRLFIVGEGGERANLQNIIDRLGLGNLCQLLGHRTDVVDLHHGFDLFVQSSDYEGTPNAILEAMAMETPVVATRAGGTAELIQDGVHGLLLTPGDSAQLADAMALALSEPIATAQRTAAARQRVELEFSFDQRLRAVEAIYEQLVEEKLSRNSSRGTGP
jgi:glycosyltransferase involved in cell wall biosynthesis